MKTRMRAQRRILETTVREHIKIGPEVAERMTLESAPDAATVGCFVLTGGARLAWAAINQQLGGSHGGFFWINGGGGTGKTHFLNYIIALSSRAGSLSVEAGRHLVLAVEISGPAATTDVDRMVVDAVAKELTGDKRADLWQTMKGAEALRLALESARRQGVKTVTAAIDFGSTSSEPAAAYLNSIAEMARSLKHPQLIVIAAARNKAAEGAPAQTFTVAPEADEVMAVAIGRARRLEDGAVHMVDDAYRTLNIGDEEARAIFPLHPAAVAALRALVGSRETIARLARMVREVLIAWRETAAFQRIVAPAEMMKSEAVRTAVEAKLGNIGCAALRIAHGATDAAAENERDLAQQVVDTLMLHEIAGGVPPLTLEELRARIPAIAAAVRVPGPALPALLEKLAQRSNGVIIFDAHARSARFNPQAAGAPEVTGFNAALPLIRRFDSTLTAVRELSELGAKLKRLGDAMGSALEGAHRNRELLVGALRETGGTLSAEQEQAFADFIAIAESGPRALIEMSAEADRSESTLHILASYEALAVIAGAVPRLRAMREYLDETQLRASLEEDPKRDQELSKLETACEMLRAAINPAALTNAARSLDALEARFQTFKWTYVQHYRPAHEAWRIEAGRLSGIVEDTNRYLDGLRRLNSIVALGPAEGAQLDAQMAPLVRRVVRCDLEGPLSPEITPRCPRCGFVIGTASPREELNDLATHAKRALNSKLAILSQSAIAQLIEQHDHNHRLDGFLKITQAAQTEALVRVLDDKLTRYLGRLLDENLAAAHGVESGGRAVVQTLRTRFKRDGHARGIKLPPSGGGR